MRSTSNLSDDYLASIACRTCVFCGKLSTINDALCLYHREAIFAATDHASPERTDFNAKFLDDGTLLVFYHEVWHRWFDLRYRLVREQCLTYYTWGKGY